jgi:N-acetylglucosaminyldiphosphoundecaprenol N-acetyl-beta-D-mannosaminyltransferase
MSTQVLSSRLNAAQNDTTRATGAAQRERAHPIALMGVLFDNVTIDETVRLIEQMVESRQPHYMATANVDFLVQARHDVELRRILMDAHLVLCDGTPLLWASRLLGNPLPERVAGSDLVPLLIKIAALRKYRIFFLGGSPDVSERAVQRLREQYPDLIIAGHYSPPFSHLLEMNHDEIVCRIKQAQPDFLFVSFGCPKQEKWIAMHYRTLGVPVSVGVGATIDFLAGQALRAPHWMRRAGLEWVFRMAQEPRRLFRRYMRDMGSFSVAMTHQLWEMRMGGGPAVWRKPNLGAPRHPEQSGQRVRLPERLDVETVRRCAILCEDALANSTHCLLELDHVQSIDSTGIGMLMRIQKQARISGRQLVLVAPSMAVRRGLKLMRLEDFFLTAKNIEDAERLIGRQNSSGAPATPPSGKPELHWTGEITASTTDRIWKQTELFLEAVSGRRVRIDLASVRFMDSSGVALMLRARRYASQKGMELWFTDPHPNVRNVLRISKLEGLIHQP